MSLNFVYEKFLAAYNLLQHATKLPIPMSYDFLIGKHRACSQTRLHRNGVAVVPTTRNRDVSRELCQWSGRVCVSDTWLFSKKLSVNTRTSVIADCWWSVLQTHVRPQFSCLPVTCFILRDKSCLLSSRWLHNASQHDGSLLQHGAFQRIDRCLHHGSSVLQGCGRWYTILK